MRELALNILDIVENSIAAKASLVEIKIIAKDNLLTINIVDNGCGMDEDFLNRVCDPFTTTRTTRKVGMGIPLFKMASELSGGHFKIDSKINVGTTITATFEIDNIDRKPLGNLGATFSTLLDDEISTDFVLNFKVENKNFEFDTRELKKEINGIPINNPEIVLFVKDMINENIKEIGGAKL